MKILIIGSEGFIGKHCVMHLRNAGNMVYGTDLFEQASADYTYFKVSRLSPEFDELLKETVFDAVINAAGSGNVPYSMTHPVMDFEANCLDTIRILDAIRKHQPACKYLHLSSAAVYGNPNKLPVKESDTTQPLSPYGWHKLVAEQLCHEYANIFGLHTAIVRPFSVYGPGLQKQFFWDVYKKIKNVSGPVELFGTGKESRDYIYITDLIGALLLILHQGEMKAEIYNLGSGDETTIADVVKSYFNVLTVNQEYYFNGHVREGDPLNWRADISKIKTLGFSQHISLQQGLQQLAVWIQQF